MCVSSHAVSKFTYYWTVKLTGDTVTVTKLKRNYDSVLVWANKISDSLNQVVPRSNWFTDHSKTFAWMNIDTISGKVRCDTIVADSLGIRIIRMTGLPSGGTGDSCLILKSGVPTIISASSYRVMIGAASTVQLADSCFKKANKLHGVTAGYVPYAATDSTFSASGMKDSTTYMMIPSKKLVFGAKPTHSYYFSISQGKYLTSYGGGANESHVGIHNAYYSDTWRYRETDGIGAVNLSLGGNGWLINAAASGTQGDVITWKRSISGDSTGRISVKSTSFDSTFKVDGSANVTGNAKIGGHLNAATATYTGTVSVDSIKSTKGIAATTGTFSSKVQGTYFTTNGEDSLVYEDTLFYDSLYDGTTYRSRSVCRLIRIGNQITMSVQGLSGTITAGTATYLKGIPARFHPPSARYIVIPILNDGVTEIGILNFDGSGICTIQTALHDFLTGSANSGWGYMVAVWTK